MVAGDAGESGETIGDFCIEHLGKYFYAIRKNRTNYQVAIFNERVKGKAVSLCGIIF